MQEPASRRTTVYFDPELHAALRLKAAQSNRSVSEIGRPYIESFTRSGTKRSS